MLACVALVGPIFAKPSIASLTDDPPRVWTWSPATGTAAAHPSLRSLVRVSVSAASNPVSVANMVCNQILARGLGPGEVAITLAGYGRGTLVGNPLDAMQRTGLPPELERGTPWTAHGVAAMAAWTDAFIARYQQRQALDGVPAPSRFHMDCELRLPALCFLPNVEPCWGTAPLQVFAAMQSDPRWPTEPMPMNPAGVPAWRTMSEIYASAGSPSFDPALPRDAEANRAWSAWWDGAMREAVDGALDLAFYSRVKAAWPDVLASEFAQSLRLDGDREPDGGRRGYIDFEWWNQGWMPASAWCGRADLQAPALYLFGETFIDRPRPFMDEQMRLHRANLDACLHSFGGIPPSQATPWISLPNVALPFGESPATLRSVTSEEFMRILALLRSRGVQEFIAWPTVDDATWSAVAGAIDAVWTPSLSSVHAVAGSLPPDASTLLERGDRSTCEIVPSKAGFDLHAEFDPAAPSPCSAEGSIWIAVEATCAAQSVWSIEIGLTEGGWRTVASPLLEASRRQAFWLGPIDARGVVDPSSPSETIRIRIASAGSAATSIDLLQLVHWPHRRGDLDLDGIVDSLDLSRLLAAWSTDDAASDLDRSGVVDSADLAILLGAWGAACP